MPIVDAILVASVGAAHRHGVIEDAASGIVEETVADFAARIGEKGLFIALRRNEQHIGAIERAHRLDGHMLGIARADPDDQYLSQKPVSRATLRSRFAARLGSRTPS